MRHRARSNSGENVNNAECHDYEADLFQICNFTLRWFPVPMYLYIITAVGDVLITPLWIGEPSPKVFLRERSIRGRSRFSSANLGLKFFYLRFNIRFVHVRILFNIGKSIDKERMF